MTDLIAHLTRQGAFGRATFGPGPRTEGVLKHIESEIDMISRLSKRLLKIRKPKAAEKKPVDRAKVKAARAQRVRNRGR